MNERNMEDWLTYTAARDDGICGMASALSRGPRQVKLASGSKDGRNKVEAVELDA